MKIGKRLTQLDAMITSDYQHIWDCCCDHGLLGMRLLQRNAAPFVHFVDIVPALMKQVTERLSDSYPLNLPGENRSQWKTHTLDVAELPLDKYSGKQLVIIAGVGGDETINLVDRLYQRFPSLDIEYLVCPVYHQYALRQHMRKLGLGLLDEHLLRERKQFYEILLVSNNSSEGIEISPAGAKIWRVENKEQFDIAQEYQQRVLTHYRRSRRKLGKEVEEKIRDYENVLIEFRPDSERESHTCAGH